MISNHCNSPVNLLPPLYSANTTPEMAITAARKNPKTTMTNPALLRQRYAFVPRIPVTYVRAVRQTRHTSCKASYQQGGRNEHTALLDHTRPDARRSKCQRQVRGRIEGGDPRSTIYVRIEIGEHEENGHYYADRLTCNEHIEETLVPHFDHTGVLNGAVRGQHEEDDECSTHNKPAFGNAQIGGVNGANERAIVERGIVRPE